MHTYFLYMLWSVSQKRTQRESKHTVGGMGLGMPRPLNEGYFSQSLQLNCRGKNKNKMNKNHNSHNAFLPHAFDWQWVLMPTLNAYPKCHSCHDNGWGSLLNSPLNSGLNHGHIYPCFTDIQRIMWQVYSIYFNICLFVLWLCSLWEKTRRSFF